MLYLTYLPTYLPTLPTHPPTWSNHGDGRSTTVPAISGSRLLKTWYGAFENLSPYPSPPSGGADATHRAKLSDSDLKRQPIGVELVETAAFCAIVVVLLQFHDAAASKPYARAHRRRVHPDHQICSHGDGGAREQLFAGRPPPATRPYRGGFTKRRILAEICQTNVPPYLPIDLSLKNSLRGV